MRAAEFLSDVSRVIEERSEPAHRLEQAYLALTRSLVRNREEATNLLKRLRAAREFLRYEKSLGLSATLWPSRGQDIVAACGQLAVKDLRGCPVVIPNP
jgi:adenine C2-methylase RlmN of 23S rRNA A2503 and tRNA A37